MSLRSMDAGTLAGDDEVTGQSDGGTTADGPARKAQTVVMLRSTRASFSRIQDRGKVASQSGRNASGSSDAWQLRE